MPATHAEQCLEEEKDGLAKAQRRRSAAQEAYAQWHIELEKAESDVLHYMTRVTLLSERATAERFWGVRRDDAMRKKGAMPSSVPMATCLQLPPSAIGTGRWLMAPKHEHSTMCIPVYVLMPATAGGFFVWGQWDDGEGVQLCPADVLMAPPPSTRGRAQMARPFSYRPEWDH
jgi:hypothetical protein